MQPQQQPPAKAFYHVREQDPFALLAPIEAELVTIESRLHHYAERLRMADESRGAIERARAAVTKARTEVGTIVAASRPVRG